MKHTASFSGRAGGQRTKGDGHALAKGRHAAYACPSPGPEGRQAMIECLHAVLAEGLAADARGQIGSGGGQAAAEEGHAEAADGHATGEEGLAESAEGFKSLEKGLAESVGGHEAGILGHAGADCPAALIHDTIKKPVRLMRMGIFFLGLYNKAKEISVLEAIKSHICRNKPHEKTTPPSHFLLHVCTHFICYS
jgi:hypothetical protein